VANLSAQIEAFLRNALRQKRLEDQRVRQALRDLRGVLAAVERVVGESGVAAPQPGRNEAIARLTAAIARSVRDSFGVPQLAALSAALAPWLESQLRFARQMVEMAGGDLAAPTVQMTATQAARIVRGVQVAGTTMENQLLSRLPAMVADRVERFIRLGVQDVAGGPTFATYENAVVRTVGNAVEATIRTGVHEAGGFAQQMIYQYETDPDWLGPDGLVWTAILDSRVCPTCLALDGTRYQLGVPAPYFDGENKTSPHPQCRCYLLPWKWRNDTEDGQPLNREATGDRGAEALSFRAAASQWVRDNPETARAIFGKALGQRLIDGKIGFDQAVKLWSAKG
jgi:hypothetical protein